MANGEMQNKQGQHWGNVTLAAVAEIWNCMDNMNHRRLFVKTGPARSFRLANRVIHRSSESRDGE